MSSSQESRSVFAFCVPLLACLTLVMTTACVFAQAPLAVEKIKDNVYLVKGGAGANTGFVVRDQDVVVIDAKMTPAAAGDMLAAIAKAVGKPVTTVILTHSDGDHVNGLPGLPKGLKIVAHANVKRDMEKAVAEAPALKDYLPTETYDKEMVLGEGTSKIVLKNPGSAHTDGDSIVTIPTAGVAFIGDLVFLGRDPLIHKHKNGTFARYLKTLRSIADMSPAPIILSGHTDPVGSSELKALIASMEEKQTKVKAMIAEGKTLDEVKTAFSVPAGGRWPSLVEIIYTETKGEGK